MTPNENIAADMGARLRALRLALGYDSAAAFARYLEMPVSTVRRCERGQLLATHRAIPLGLALCEKAGFSLDWFICGIPQGKTRATG